MERIIIRGLIMAVLPILVTSLLAAGKKTQKKDGKVFLHKLFPVVGAIGTAFSLVSGFITSFSDEPIWVPVVFFVFSLLAIALIIAYVNCRISYDENGFIAKNFFGRKKQATYSEITGIQKNMHETYIYIGKQRIMVDEFAIGGDDFIAFAKNKYKTLHNGQNIPKVQKTKNDIFNGNINDASAILAVFILIAVFLIGFLAFITWHTFFDPCTEENTIQQSVRFVAFEKGTEDLILTAEDGQIYKIRFADEKINTQGISAICNGETLVTVYAEEFKDENDAPFYSLKAIVHKDAYLLHFDETNRLHSQGFFPIFLFALGMCILWAVYILLSVIIGRNPQKFSKKVVRLFFRDGYVSY